MPPLSPRRRLWPSALAIFLGCVLAIGGGVLYLDIESAEARAVAVARAAVGTALDGYRARLTSPWTTGARSELRGLVDMLLAEHFLVAELYDRAAQPIVKGGRPGIEPIEEAFDASLHAFPADTTTSVYRTRLVGSGLYVQVITQVLDETGKRLGFFEGIYEVPRDTLAEIQLRFFWSLLVALLVSAVLTALIARRLRRGG
jgi:hypothetical protein